MTAKLSDIKEPEKGYVINCLIDPKEDQKGPMFDGGPNGEAVAFLDGYAIIPIEVYEKLVDNNRLSLSDAIKDVNADYLVNGLKER